MADPIDSLIDAALTRAAAEPAGMPLLAAKAVPGLFPATAAGKTAARRACDAGWFTFSHDGKTVTVTPKGFDRLVSASNPKPILDDFVRVLESRDEQVRTLIRTCQEMSGQIQALKRVVETVLPSVVAKRTAAAPRFPLEPDTYESGSTTVMTAIRIGVAEAILNRLEEFQQTSQADCPLPILFRDLPTPTTVGEFHDCLRGLHAEERIYLHPWTGPLYELPEPGLSLLVGHEVAYYASLRDDA